MDSHRRVCARGDTLGPVETAEQVLERLGPHAALTHESAARRHGLELVVDSGVERVTVPRNRGRARATGWRIHRSALGAGDADVDDDGLRLSTPARTVADLCRVLPLDHAVAAADSALRQQLVPLEVLRHGLLPALGSGASRLRAVGRLMDPRSESVLESLLRVLLAVSGLPEPVPQYEVRDGSGRQVARVDLCWPGLRLVVEADGFAFHSDRGSYRRDRARSNELERLGWRVLRFTWEDVVGRPASVVALVADCLRLAWA